jgi:hypothetical protein
MIPRDTSQRDRNLHLHKIITHISLHKSEQHTKARDDEHFFAPHSVRPCERAGTAEQRQGWHR